MAYNDNSCSVSKGNTGLSQCLDDLGYDYMLLHTPTDYEIDTEANAKLEATYLTGINAHNIYPMPAFEKIEDTSEDDVNEDTSLGNSIPVREGKYGATGSFRVALCNLAALRTFNNVKGRVFIVTSNGKIFGTSPDGTKFKGFELSKFKVSLLKGTDGTTARWVHLEYQLANPTEMGDFPAVPDITAWNPTTLVGVKDVTVTVVSSSATSVVVDVSGNCDGEGVEGLVVGDFQFLNDSAVEQTPTSVTDNEDGTYTCAFTDAAQLAADDYTVDLLDPASQTTGGYESAAAASFTIS